MGETNSEVTGESDEVLHGSLKHGINYEPTIFSVKFTFGNGAESVLEGCFVPECAKYITITHSPTR